LQHHDIVSDEYADYILSALDNAQKKLQKRINNDGMDADELRQLERFIGIAIRMVKGETLTTEESRILMSVRTLMSVNEE
jgi:hypothetical protein